MRRIAVAGFTLVELMIVIAIIGLLSAVLVTSFIPAQNMAYEIADRANLQQQYQWLEAHKRQLGRLPMQGGHRFVLSSWTSGIVEPTLENYDRFWTPGPARSSDPRYHEQRAVVARGGNPWPTLAATQSIDTGYAGRANDHLRTMERAAEEALMAVDNEFGWSLRDGTINVLFTGGTVRSYSYPMLREIFGLPPFDPTVAVPTTGPESPIEACRKLAR